LFIRARKFLRIGHYDLSDNLKVASVFVKWFLVIALVCIATGIGIPHFFLKEFQYDLVTPFCQICPGHPIFRCTQTILPGSQGKFADMLPFDNIMHPGNSMYTAVSTTMAYLAAFIFVFYLLTTSFIRRMWCRLCPISALLGLLNRFSFLSLRKEGKRCTKCGICLRSCPMQVEEVYEEKEKERIASTDCTLCFRCVEMCPEKKALKIGFFRHPIAISKFKRFERSSAVRASRSTKEKIR
jgi:ferredoxin-type protein NapH